MMDLNAKRVLGQNFLIDKNKILEIVNCIPNVIGSTIIEVGPGTGALTEYILKKDIKKLLAIEIDINMIRILKKKNLLEEKITLIHGDILKMNWNEITNDENVNFVSNLPYYISTKIIFKVLSDKRFNSMSIMLQKELVDRIFAKKNSKNYGRLTVAIGTFFNLQKRINVSANCFYPKPKVDSGFIILIRKIDVGINIEKYLYFIKCSFSAKRKTFLNSLKNANFIKIDEIKKYLIENKIDLSIRSEQISIDEFIMMFKLINE